MQGAIAGAKELLKNVSEVEDIDSISCSGEYVPVHHHLFFNCIRNKVKVECKEYVNFIDNPNIDNRHASQ
jgi:hypothetical protein